MRISCGSIRLCLCFSDWPSHRRPSGWPDEMVSNIPALELGRSAGTSRLHASLGLCLTTFTSSQSLGRLWVG
jgi:hypothetical protein